MVPVQQTGLARDDRGARSASGRAEIILGPDWGWIVSDTPAGRLSFRGYLTDGAKTLAGQSAADHVARTLQGAADDDALRRALTNLSGHFAFVLETPARIVACVDRIRSIPLLWGEAAGKVLIDDRGRRLRDRLGLSVGDLDPDQALAVAMSGYTVGGGTMYRGLRGLRPGEALIVEASAPRTLRWFIYDAWSTEEAAQPEKRLSELHRFMIERLASSADGRAICVPLSAGLDSRMIAAGLRAVGCKNVRLFAYGRPGNHEIAASKAIAERLGFPWTFVPFSGAMQRAMLADPRHEQSIWQDADTCAAVPFEQDWIAIAKLKQDGWIPADAIVVNGQTGDFITGNHVPKAFLAGVPASPELRRELAYASILDKHYTMWSSLRRADNDARMIKLLDNELADVGASFDTPAPHGICEFLEYQERQAKYVVAGQRAYEAQQLEWRLPLWDDEYIAFWRRAPLAWKAGQSLYRRVLQADNWGDVWSDIPVNAKTIRPRWLVPVRLAAKAASAPLGRDRWHGIERRLFGWWMDPLRVAAVVPYLKAAADNRGARHGVSWLIERYLGEHGIEIDAALASRLSGQ